VELGLDSDMSILCSAKQGTGVEEVFDAITKYIPPPEESAHGYLSALIFDAQYDSFRGTVVSCRVFSGSISPGDVICLMSNKAVHKVEEVGIFRLKREPKESLSFGEIGYIIAGIKAVSDVRVGDTITLQSKPIANPVLGFKEVKPVVFSSLYPVSSDDYIGLANALEKYRLNDAALVFQKDSSAALGMGFRCGFLGILHLEIVQERLEREFEQSIIMTVPTVEYRFFLKNGKTVSIDNPLYYPDPTTIEKSMEPYVKADIIIPERYIGAIMELCLERRGVNSKLNYPSRGRIEVRFDMPLAEVIYDFYDRLKTVTQGYGSFDYELLDYRENDLVKLDILVNGERVDALAQIVHRDRARSRALQACEKLKEEIPRHLFKIPIQGVIGNTIIARSTISPFRKDVTAKCYGGDITRKRKLLEKQKKGKKKMKVIGSVTIPQSAFVSLFKADNK
jgi:GTP-binding protein LepA